MLKLLFIPNILIIEFLEEINENFLLFFVIFFKVLKEYSKIKNKIEIGTIDYTKFILQSKNSENKFFLI